MLLLNTLKQVVTFKKWKSWKFISNLLLILILNVIFIVRAALSNDDNVPNNFTIRHQPLQK